MNKGFLKISIGIAICAASTVALASGDSSSYIKSGWSVGIDGGYGYMSSPEATYPNDYSVNIDGVIFTYTKSTDVGDWVWGVHIARDFKVSTNLLLGMELGYKDLGDANNHIYNEMESTGTIPHTEDYAAFNRDYSQNAVDFLLTAHYYLWQGLNIFGKAGVAYVRSDTEQCYDYAGTLTDNNRATAGDSSTDIYDALNGDNEIWRLEPEFSLGVGYMFKCHVDIHAAYTYIGGASDQPIITPSNVVYQPKAKVYSTNMVMAGISYTF